MSRASSRDASIPFLRNGDGVSRSRSRLRHAQHSAANSISVGPEVLVNPGVGALINEEESELLRDLVHPHQHHHALEETLVEEEAAAEEFDTEWKQKLPWYKRPSPWWFLSYVPFAAIAMTITMAAKVELFIYLACLAHRPVASPDHGGSVVSLLARHVSAAFDAPNQRVCASDPTVLAVAAKLNTAMTTSMGILACMTTAWWGSLSDRYGRTRILGCAVVGVLLMDLCFLSTFWFYEYIPGGYWFLLIGPIFEGILGGQTLINGTIHAYIADCTPPALRSGMFSLNLGLLFTGVAIGPLLGGLLIRFTNKFIIVFYISAVIHVIYALLVWFVIPESLSKAEMLDARARHKVANEEYFAAHAHGGVLVFFKRMFSFLTPLAIFLPVRVDGPKRGKGLKKDWNLLFIVLSYGFVISLMGLYFYVIQYLEATYEWDTEQVGYWFSSVGATRAVFLTIILPIIIRFFKPKPVPIRLPEEVDEPLSSPTNTTSPAEDPTRVHPPSSHSEHHHDANFDLTVAKISMGVEITVYTLMVFSTSGLMFAAIATLGSLGMGFGPAIQSVALTLYNRQGGKDSGKLFGAMSVVQSLSSGVLGPFVYGLTYINTVSTYPKAIFVMGGGAVTTSFLLLQLVRLPKDVPMVLSAEDVDLEDRLVAEPEPTIAGVEREDTLVGLSEPLIIVDDEDRGRKVVKTLP